MPLDLGSGGGGAEWLPAGAGGGAVRLVVSDRLGLDGLISADGEAGGGNAGGGSGGSIWIEAGELTGGGAVRAKGGDGGEGAGGGAGGRVAVYFDRSSFTGQKRSSVAGAGGAEAGTCGFMDRSVTGRGLALYHRYALPDGAQEPWGRVEVFGGGLLVSGTDARLTVAGDMEVAAEGQVILGGGSWLGVTNALRLKGTNAVIVAKAKQTASQVNNLWSGVGVTIQAGSLEVGSGARITADGQGYPGSTSRGHPGKGPGGGGQGGDYNRGGGGGYGGQGQSVRGIPMGWGGAAYGSAQMPLDLGSGGGGADGSRGGAGGGALRLIAGSRFRLEGLISADGEAGAGNGGGGSGGSIWIEAGELTGGGVVRARGGEGGEGAGAGAGGRVAVYYDRSEYTGQAACSVDGAQGGGEGTFAWIDRSAPVPILEVHHRLAFPDGSTNRWGDVRIHAGGLLVLGADARLAVDRGMELAGDGQAVLGGGSWLGITNELRLSGSNATVVVQGLNRTAPVNGTWQGAGATIQAGNVIIAEGARIGADAQGYPGGAYRGNPGLGPGGGGPAGDYGVSAGGGYGGYGARPASRPQVWRGPAYGSAALPFDLGSGGGGAESSQPGGGGGALRLIVGERLQLDGTVSANGGDGTGNAGGGSGGSVVIQAGILAGSGRIEARGGAGAPDAGGGGGGRIALYYWDKQFFPTNACDLGVGANGVEGTVGTLTVAGPSIDVAWTGLDDAALHGVERIGWAAMGINPIGASVSLALNGEGICTQIATAKATRDGLDWDTSRLPDGQYELRLRVWDADGRLVREWPRWIALNNSALWHSGTVTASEIWTADVLHLVEGQITVSAGVTLAVSPGAIVKFAPGAALRVAAGGTCDVRGTDEAPVVLTALEDDRIHGDTNQDGTTTVPIPGEWKYGVEGNGRFLANARTTIRFATQQHGGSLSEDTRFAGHVVHEVRDVLTIPAGRTLFVEPGAVLKFHGRAGLFVAAGGRLEALGTPSEPIVFTSSNDDSVGGDAKGDGAASTPAAGDWLSVEVDGEAVFDHVDFRYGGGSPSGQWQSTGLLRVASGGRALLSRSRLQDALLDGVLGFGTVTLENCLLLRADRALAVHGGLTRAVHCTFHENRIGVQMHGGQLELWNSIVADSIVAGVIRDLGAAPHSIRFCDLWNPQ
ncbi:MAG: hypothetical protein JNL97_15895, partial [Verrucomicrobiales bacterium]|nr:hypothetical protein [Verrucomicrobiales bacterium]